MSGGNGLFEVEPAAEVKPGSGPSAPVTKTFRVCAPDQTLLLPPSLDEWLPQNHLARFVTELVDEAGQLHRSRLADHGFVIRRHIAGSVALRSTIGRR